MASYRYIWSELSDLKSRIKRRSKPQAEVQEGPRAATYKRLVSELSAKGIDNFRIESFALPLQFEKMEALDEVDRPKAQLYQLNTRSN